MSKGKVQVTIGRTSCSRSPDFISLRIKDEASKEEIVYIKIPLEDFSQIITGLVVGDLKTEFGDLSIIGKKLETKIEYIPYDKKRTITMNEWQEYINKLANEYRRLQGGWKPDPIDSYNYYYDTDKGYKVVYRRYT